MLGRRAVAIATVGCTALFGGFALATPAGAANRFPVNDTVNATTTLKKLSQTIVVPQGTLKGSINANTGILKGNLKLPPASSTVKLAGIGLAKATFTMVPTKPVIGKINFNNFTMTSTSVFNIHVNSVDPVGTSLNLVGNSCTTSQPVTLKLGGALDIFGSSTFSGTYTIPPLANCGLSTVVLNQLLAGPGNTLTATFAPAN